MSAELQACADLVAVREFREELRNRPPNVVLPEQKITATPDEVQAAIERANYVRRQQSFINSLAIQVPLFRTRIELSQLGERMRVYFSPMGFDFKPVAPGEGDDILVSWAHPNFLSLRDLDLGQVALLANSRWRIEAKTELNRENLGVLYDLAVRGIDAPEVLFAEVRFEGAEPRALLADAVDGEVLPIDEEIIPLPAEIELPERTRLGLDTVVRNRDGKVVEIPFALDERQWQAMALHADSGTIRLTGPAGTGKTTVALLRATTLVHSIYQYDAQGRPVSEIPKVDLRKDRFRVVVVTEHLRNYLKDFLASSELGLPEVQVVNLRGSFLETFVRHKTLTKWIAGVRFRLSPRRNKVSDALLFIKALPTTLQLCFFHSAVNARQNAGKECGEVCDRINTRVHEAFQKATIDRLLNHDEREALRREEEASGFNVDAFLERHKKRDEFEKRFTQGHELLRRGVAELRGFLRSWLAAVDARVMQSVERNEEVWLLPGGDDLLLARFVDEVRSLHRQEGLLNLFVREAWRELVALVDPRQVLERVVEDFTRKGDMKSLEEAGLTNQDALSALKEWQATLTGSTEDDEDEEEDDTIIEDTIDDQEDAELKRRRGAFTRSDFPLLASIARVFLALPPEAKANPERYQRVGFLLPDDVPRYDHVIIDEGQDFTYAEIHLVCSLVENERMAITVSGDPWQRMDWRSGLSSLETISLPPERSFQITRNYRQTVELSRWISRLSVALYGEDGHIIEPAHEHGPAPRVEVLPVLAEVLKATATKITEWFDGDQDPFTAVLLLGFDPRTKTKITNTLSRLLEDRAIHVEKIEDGRQIERGRVSVADPTTVKGLEFDNVVVMVSADACSSIGHTSPQARVVSNHLYVACSRAKRGLEVILQENVPLLQRV